MAFVCFLLRVFQGEAEVEMIELAAVGLPPPEEGSLFFDYFLLFLFLVVSFWFVFLLDHFPFFSFEYFKVNHS